ncbi:dihydrolipoyl dehydrogenase [Isachenkonia alkalipeptolytica]|uniref:Dihydrolipoyl dehydrogenase n=1 Tax=Isachenkonia alkalipeptolytica TaxID=2565777 RepID=A0AA44BED3_9CLOT|nr:dihydrolipoyl dehydrogenase [Isachenkonia alkalipeptolytica]NBG88035.1 dihydrolipoyl dehydrogenase [Isachenkonia alkalipeptolytica]
MKDVIVIGGGPGGYVAAIRAAQLGADVTVIEKENLGGTCLNKGCIPTKALFKNAEMVHSIGTMKEFGVNLEGGFTIDIPQIHKRKEEVVFKLVDGVRRILNSYDIETVYGEATIKDRNRVKVQKNDGETIDVETKNIIIATGATPFIPENLRVDHPGIMTSDEIINFDNIPKSLVIIGGGVIGMEFANIFHAMGTEVHVVEHNERILHRLDSDLSKRLQAHVKKQGMKIHNNALVKELNPQEDGSIEVIGERKGKELKVDCEKVLVAVGRRPNLEGMNLEDLGVHHSPRGIEVNENYETNVEGIYAIGDVTGGIMLAHEASHHGIIAAEASMNKRITHNGSTIPSAIFTSPEVATVGLSEEEAKAKKMDYVTSKFMFGGNGKALAMGDTQGFIKVIANGDTIVGVHIMGLNASDLIHEGVLAVSKGMRIDDITGTVHAHPTMSEGFAEAVLGLKGVSIHALASKKKKSKG